MYWSGGGKSLRFRFGGTSRRRVRSTGGATGGGLEDCEDVVVRLGFGGEEEEVDSDWVAAAILWTSSGCFEVVEVSVVVFETAGEDSNGKKSGSGPLTVAERNGKSGSGPVTVADVRFAMAVGDGGRIGFAPLSDVE